MKGKVYLFIGVLLLTGCNSSTLSSRESCETLREHSIELELNAATQAGLGQISSDVLEGHKLSLRQALGGRFIEECLRNDAALTTCALQATSTDQFNKCHSQQELP